MSPTPHVVRQFAGEFRQLTEAEAGYLAGLIDGEGTISIYARPREKNISHVLNEHISLVNTNLAIMEFAGRTIGNGTLYQRKRGDTRICYSLQYDGQRAVHVVGMVLPYLVGKLEQAKLVIEMANLRESRRSANWVDYTDRDLEEMSRIVNQIALLNGGRRTPLVITRTQPRKLKPGRHGVKCEVEGCAALRVKNLGGFCQAHYAEMLAQLHTVTCEGCGKEFEAQRLGRRFCSPECQWRAGRLRREGKGGERRFPCPQCGVEVVTTDARKVACSQRCYSRMKYEERKQSGYFDERKQKVLEGSKLKMGLCARCGVEMEITSPRKRFCSPECRQMTVNEKEAAKRHKEAVETRETHTCPTCGKLVDRSHYARKTFCSDHCRESMRARQKKMPEGWKIERNCAVCGTPFSTKQGKQIYCSSPCTKKAYRLRQKES